MKQSIAGFRVDAENHWVAELACGHGQHMRHDPPWVERPWVLTKEGRDSRLGTELNCLRCDELAENVKAAVITEAKRLMLDAYEDGGRSGLCADGRFELALDSLHKLKLQDLKI